MRNLIYILILTLFLTACGGGGGGKKSNPADPLTYYTATQAPGDNTPGVQMPKLVGLDGSGKWVLEFEMSNHVERFSSDSGPNPQWSNGWVLVNWNPDNGNGVSDILLFNNNHDGLGDLIHAHWILTPIIGHG